MPRMKEIDASLDRIDRAVDTLCSCQCRVQPDDAELRSAAVELAWAAYEAQR